MMNSNATCWRRYPSRPCSHNRHWPNPAPCKTDYGLASSATLLSASSRSSDGEQLFFAPARQKNL